MAADFLVFLLAPNLYFFFLWLSLIFVILGATPSDFVEPSTYVVDEETEDAEEETIAAPAPTAGPTFSLPALAVDESEILLFAPFGPDYLDDEDEEDEEDEKRSKKKVKKGRGKGDSPSILNFLDQGMSTGFGQFSVR